jgi:hypothetical protein
VGFSTVWRPARGAQSFDLHPFDAHLACGFTEPTGDFGQRLDTGWHITGGGGFNLVTFFDPWFGFGQSFIPTNQVLGRFSKSSGGYDAGAGLTFKLGSSGTSFYTEARYYYAPTEPTATEFVPLSFGLRW